MNNFDLDISNYNVEDILNLFNLNYNFDKTELKKAKKIALKTHPDKSGLNKDIFMFFTKAFKIVEQIYYFRNKKKQSTEYFTEDLEGNEELLKKFNGMKVSDFNKVFNKMFEDVKLRDEEVDTGYGDWLRSDENICNEKVNNVSQFENAFERQKQQCSSLIVRKGVEDIEMKGGGYNLSRDKMDMYTTDIFSKLNYDDLKRAHTETVVPVTREDFINKQKFNNLDEIKRHRNATNTNSLSLQQSQMLLRQRDLENDKVNTQRAFNLIKQDEAIMKANNKWWSSIRQIGN